MDFQIDEGLDTEELYEIENIPDPPEPEQITSPELKQLRKDIFDYYVANGIKTPAELHRFITSWSGETLPFIPVCSHHQTPFTYACLAYFGDHLDISNNIIVANRGGGKTKTTAKVNATDLVTKPGLELASAGAIKRQAAKCYKYTRGLLFDDIAKDLVKTSIMESTEMWNGAVYEQLIGTMTGMNSPHPQKLRFDEVEVLQRPEVLEEAFMVPKSMKLPDGTVYKAALDIISSRKFMYGLMQQLIENAEAKRFRVLVWCYKEIAEPCLVERRGEARVVLDLENPDTLEAYPCEVWEGCEHCPLVFSCRGDLARSTGYYLIDDLIDILSRTSRRTWKAQMECDRPGSEGLVYPDYNDEVGGSVIPNCEPPDDYYIVEGSDYGVANPTAIVWLAIAPDLSEIIIFDEHKQSGWTVNTHTKKILKTRSRYDIKPRWCFGDPSAKATIIEYRQRGIKVLKGFNNVAVGIDIVNTYVEPDEDGIRRLKICERCVETRKEFRAYHFPEGGGDKPVEKDDHLMDGARYGISSAHILIRRLLKRSRESKSGRSSRKRPSRART